MMNSWRRKRKIIIYNGSNLKTDRKLVIGCFANFGPDSLVVRASASGLDRTIPKALKMVLVAPLLTLVTKG